jgi:hypothetical protein
MTSYSIILFLHIAASLVLVAAFSLEAVVLSRLRRIADWTAARLWTEPLAAVPPMGVVSMVGLLLTGGYLTDRSAAWSEAWPKVAVAMLVAIGALGGISGARLRAIRRLSLAGGAALPELCKRVLDPVVRTVLRIRVSLLAGAILLMTARPPLRECLSMAGLALLLGLIAALPVWRAAAANPTARLAPEK